MPATAEPLNVAEIAFIAYLRAKAEGDEATAAKVRKLMANNEPTESESLPGDLHKQLGFSEEDFSERLNAERPDEFAGNNPQPQSPPRPGLKWELRDTKRGKRWMQVKGSQSAATPTGGPNAEPTAAKKKSDRDADIETKKPSKEPKYGEITSAARPALSEDEESAIEHYTASAWINDELRGQELRPESKMFPESRKDEVRKYLATAFSKIKQMDKPVKVYRGLYFDNEEEKNKFLSSLNNSGVITWPGYTSTSPSEATAKGYMDKHGVSLQISAVEGLDLHHYGSGDSGGEFVLPHNSQFVVKGITKDGDETVVHVEQLRKPDA